MSTRRIIRLDEQSDVLSLERRTTKHSSSRRIICLGQAWAINVSSSGYVSPRSLSGKKTGTRRIILLDELSRVVRLERRTTEHGSS